MENQKIIKIICPTCQVYELSLIYDKSNNKKEKIWKCPICMHTFPESWFNTFKQFERFVERRINKND